MSPRCRSRLAGGCSVTLQEVRETTRNCMVLSPKQIAFDMAVKSRNNFDYRGIADLEELRQRDSSLSTFIDQLVEIRQSFNGALAVEGQNIAGDAPHSPLYLDFIDSDRSNTVAFKDANPGFCHLTRIRASRAWTFGWERSTLRRSSAVH